MRRFVPYLPGLTLGTTVGFVLCAGIHANGGLDKATADQLTLLGFITVSIPWILSGFHPHIAAASVGITTGLSTALTMFYQAENPDGEPNGSKSSRLRAA